MFCLSHDTGRAISLHAERLIIATARLRRASRLRCRLGCNGTCNRIAVTHAYPLLFLFNTVWVIIHFWTSPNICLKNFNGEIGLEITGKWLISARSGSRLRSLFLSVCPTRRPQEQARSMRSAVQVGTVSGGRLDLDTKRSRRVGKIAQEK